MLCKLEELQVPIPETCQRAFDEPPAVTSSNLHVVRPLSDALITTPPIHNGTLPNKEPKVGVWSNIIFKELRLFGIYEGQSHGDSNQNVNFKMLRYEIP